MDIFVRLMDAALVAGIHSVVDILKTPDSKVIIALRHLSSTSFSEFKNRSRDTGPTKDLLKEPKAVEVEAQK